MPLQRMRAWLVVGCAGFCALLNSYSDPRPASASEMERLLPVAMRPSASGPAARASQRSTPSRSDSLPPLGRPAYLVPSLDPALHSLVMRIADDAGAPLASLAGTWGPDVRHTYSKQQPWSSDNALLVIENRSPGSPPRLFLDGSTYAPRFGPCAQDSLYDFRWHPSPAHPRELINVDFTGTRLSWFDVTQCRATRAWTLPITVNYGIGSGEGNPSDDGRFIALGNDSAAFVVDMDPQPPFAPYPSARIGPVVTLPPCSLSTSGVVSCAIANLSISASGRYLDVKYAGSDDSTFEAHRIFEVDSVTLGLRPHLMAGSSLRCGSFAGRPNGWIFPLKHSDLTRDPFDHDEDIIVGARACPGSALGHVIKVRLRDGAVTPLTDPQNEAAVSHVSTRNLDRPGWAYVSYFKDGDRRQSDEIVAVKLDGSGTIEHYAHDHSLTPGCYRCEAQPVPSRDGRRVLFASNWAADCGDSCGSPGDIKDYVAWIPDAPPPASGLRVEGVVPDPAVGLPRVVYSLAGPEPATLEVVDIAGRRLFRRELGAPGPGRHAESLDGSGRVPPGVYLVRVSQAGRSASRKLVILR